MERHFVDWLPVPLKKKRKTGEKQDELLSVSAQYSSLGEMCTWKQLQRSKSQKSPDYSLLPFWVQAARALRVFVWSLTKINKWISQRLLQKGTCDAVKDLPLLNIVSKLQCQLKPRSQGEAKVLPNGKTPPTSSIVQQHFREMQHIVYDFRNIPTEQNQKLDPFLGIDDAIRPHMSKAESRWMHLQISPDGYSPIKSWMMLRNWIELTYFLCGCVWYNARINENEWRKAEKS